jgi:hypothetical protein
METKELNSKVEKLLNVYRAEGAAAAQEAFRAMVKGAKDWEARAVRIAFQSAIAGGQSNV